MSRTFFGVLSAHEDGEQVEVGGAGDERNQVRQIALIAAPPARIHSNVLTRKSLACNDLSGGLRRIALRLPPHSAPTTPVVGVDATRPAR